jgi:putative phosphoesterase
MSLARQRAAATDKGGTGEGGMGLRVAALYDVHGNLPALGAVLAALGEAAVDVVVFGGDVVWGPWPAETLTRAQSLGARVRFLRGNCETLILEGLSPPHRWARDRLTAEQRAAVAAWPRTVTLEVAGLGPTLFCHATPRSEDETLTPASPTAAWAAALAGIAERVVVCGHTHLPGEASFGGVRVVNPGSVGAPVGRAAAWWAVLGPDVELRVTDYDVVATIEAARAVVPDVRPLERWLRTPPTYEQRLASLMAPR